MDADRIQAAINHFWTARASQASKLADGGRSGGEARAAGHMSHITQLIASLFTEAGLPASCIRFNPYLPGYYRVRKQWDLAVIYKDVLVAAFEFKSQVGSVGKNINNRFEEALGSASDTWAAQRFNETYGSIPPWLGYVLVLQESHETEAPGRSTQALFPTDPVFDGFSYNERYQEMIRRFIGENIYQAGWFVTTRIGMDGTFSYVEPLETATGRSLQAAVEGRIHYVRSIVDA